MRVDFVTDQGSGKMNEDTLLIGDCLFGVFDGATSLDAYMNEAGRTGGWIASHLLKEHCNDASDSLVEILKSGNRKLREAMIAAGRDFSDTRTRWRATAVLVRVTDTEIEWAQVADSSLFLRMRDQSVQVIGGPAPHEKPLLTAWKRHADKGIGWRATREVMHQQLLEVRSDANVTYGVIDGDERFEKFIQSGSVAKEEVDELLLCTDGLEIPVESTNVANDRKALLELVRLKGLNEAVEVIRNKESSDPECLKYPRFKPHDDIAAIHISELLTTGLQIVVDR